MADWQEPVQELLRSTDQDLYLASLFFPEDKRSTVQALYAFAADVARIALVVSEAQLGEIRLQWWQDTVEAIYQGDAQANPIAQGLAQAVVLGNLPKHGLLNLITAHQFDLYSDPMASMVDLEGYLGETQSVLVQMAASILNEEDALECTEASGLAGVAYGLASLLRSLALWLARRSNFLPADLMDMRGLGLDNIKAPDFEAARGVMLAELREHARARLIQARKAAWTIKPELKPAFLHVALTEARLNLLTKAGSSLVFRPVDLMQWRKQWILWKAARTETF